MGVKLARAVTALTLSLVGCAALLAGITDGPSGLQTVVANGDAGSAAANGRPNIVLITTDDQSLTDLSVMHEVLARLGSRGTTFTHAFSPYPLCCPARATLLTGQYAHNHHVLGNTPPYGGFTTFDDTSTLGTWLQQAGYHTVLLGKYLNGYPSPEDPDYVPPGWDTWRAPTHNIYNYRRWTLNEDGALVRYAGRYETNFLGNEASTLARDYAADDVPFFMWAGFLAPHFGHPGEPDDPSEQFGSPLATPAVSRRYQDAMSDVPLPDKPSINEADVSDKPAYVKDSRRKRPTALRELNEQRLESLLSVDDAVDELLDTLEAAGELDNTLFVFTSDNGFLVGEHRRTGKIVGYEESTRVPLIVAGPGFDTGRSIDSLVSLADVAPTIAQAAGLTPPLVQDGMPLQTLVADEAAGDERSILLQAGPATGNTSRWYTGVSRWYTGIRTADFVYVEYDDGERELYDLARDPMQLTNLVGSVRAAGLERRLRGALTTLRNCSGAVCRENLDTLAAGS